MAIGITVGDLIEAVRDHLYGPQPPNFDVLADNMTTAQTTASITHRAGDFTPGAQVSIDGELCHVLDTTTNDGTTGILSLFRGFRRTEATAHVSGAQVWVGERIPIPIILRQLRQEILDWPEQLFAVRLLEQAVSAGDRVVALDNADDLAIRQLLGVHQKVTNGDWQPLRDVKLRRTNDAGDAWELDFDGTVPQAADLRIWVGCEFDLTDFMTMTTDLGDVGFLARNALMAADCVLYRFANAIEFNRTDLGALGPTSESEAVPPEHGIRTNELLWRIRQRRLATEMAAILRDFPYAETYRP